jgi:penicillin-binding protein 1A
MALPIWGKFFRKVYDDKKLKVGRGDFPRPKNLDPNLEIDCSKYDDKPLEGEVPVSEFEN